MNNKNNQVTIYTIPGCPKCQNAKEYLQKQNIAFEEINIKSDPKKAKEMIEKSGQHSVPVFDVNGTIIVGLQQDKINNALHK